MLPVAALVVGGTLLALLVGFRAVVVAVKAVVLNFLSVGAALGALVLVFQDRHGWTLAGLPGGSGTVFPIVPILAFAIVFGLSMDYEVFLVARVLEARRSGLGETAAIAEGLARTGGLITSRLLPRERKGEDFMGTHFWTRVGASVSSALLRRAAYILRSCS